MRIVRTVLGDIAPRDLGVTLGHEHVFARPPATVEDPDFRLDDAQHAIRELQSFQQAGGQTLIEMTTVDYGRDAVALAAISRASGVHLIAATGHNKGRFADPLTQTRSVSAIAAWMVAEVHEGIEGTGVRAGVIKAASSLNGAGAAELKVFEAAAIAHAGTGAPISTHTEKGTWALEQVRALADRGVPPSSLLIGHLDLQPDLSYLRAVAGTGVYLGIDQFGKAKYRPDAERVQLVVGLAEAGHLHQVLIAGDMARRSSWRSYGGGPGLAHILTTIRPLLLAAGLSAADIDTILIENPRRFLSFEPRQESV